jgi:hypothetical protein
MNHDIYENEPSKNDHISQKYSRADAHFASASASASAFVPVAIWSAFR